MNKNQKGFSTVETILVLIIVGLIGFIGWYVWNSKKDTNNEATVAVHSTSKSTTAKVASTQKIATYKECVSSNTTTKNTKTFPPTCTTTAGVVYRPTDPDNFTQGKQINIPNNPYVTTDSKVAEQDGYCFNTEVPGPQASATLNKTSGSYALVTVSPNCGDSFELTYSKTNNRWLVINTAHLGLCFHSEDNTDSSLKDPISKLCN